MCVCVCMYVCMCVCVCVYVCMYVRVCNHSVGGLSVYTNTGGWLLGMPDIKDSAVVSGDVTFAPS